MTLPIRASQATLIEVRQALQRIELNRRTAPLHNFTGGRAPLVTDDESEGYTVQSWWMDDRAGVDHLYLCTDGTTGAAVWVDLTDINVIGGASKAFKTVTPPDTNSLVADDAVGVLTITESGGCTITGNTGSDTLNIDAAGSSHNHDASDITTGLLALARGGTNADLSATGGASQVLQQASAGAAITVGQLSTSDLTYDATNLFGFFNNMFLEPISAVATSNGTTITMSLERAGGGDLTMVFSDGQTALDTTPAITKTLTPGADDVPGKSFVYILQSDKILTESTTGWPATEHIKVAYFVLQTAAEVQTEGPLATQNHNDFAAHTTTNEGHLSHITENLRSRKAIYLSGVSPTITITPNGGAPDNVDVALTSGIVSQLHPQVYPAQDTAGSDNVHVVNDSVTPYIKITDLNAALTDSAGGSMSGKYFSLVLVGIASKTGEHSPMFLNLPSGSYNTRAGAENDTDGHTNFSIPDAFQIDSSTGFLVALFLFRHQPASGGTWTLIETRDLRGLTPVSAVGGGTSLSQTEFADSQFLLFDESDSTKQMDFQLSGISTATTRTITMADRDIDLGALVVGPGSATDNAIARFDGTTGKIVQNSLVTIDDTTPSMTFTASASIKASGGANLSIVPEGNLELGTVSTDLIKIGRTSGAIDVTVQGSTKLLFRDSGLYINSSADGTLDIVADTILAITAPSTTLSGTLQVDGVATITGIADGGLTNYDLKVGDTTTPDYGMIQIGNAVIGRTSYNVGAINLDGTILIRNIGGPVTGDIEVIVTESTGNTCRLAIPKSGAGLATYHPRSWCNAGPAPADTAFVTIAYWQAQGLFDNLTFDTVADGAQLAVQGSIECEDTLYIDTIAESTTAAGVTIDGVLLKDGVIVGGGDVTAAATMGDNEIVRGDGGSRGVQDSPGVTIDDSANLAGLNSLTLADSKDLIFGATDAKFRWDIAGARNQLVLGLVKGFDATTGYFSIMELGNIGDANRIPALGVGQPILRVYGAGSVSADDWIEMFHNASNAVIAWGTGELSLDSLIGSGDVRILSGSLLIDAGNITLSGTVDGVDIAAHVADADAHHNKLHDLLGSAGHGDTVTGSPVRGDLIHANGTPAWAKFGISGTADTYLGSDGTDSSWTALEIKKDTTPQLGGDLDTNENIISLEKTGTVKANLDILKITNPVNAADMDGTSTSILFRQARVTDTLLDAVRLSAEAADDWTSVVTTQDADFVIACREQGVMTEKLRITPNATGGLFDTIGRISSRRGDGVSNPFIIFAYADSAALAPQFSLRRARGTFADPDAVHVGDTIGALEFRGFDVDSSGNFRWRAGVEGVCDGAPSANTVPTAIVFATNTNANPIDRMTIDSSGDVSLDTAGAELSFSISTSHISGANGTLEYSCAAGVGHVFMIGATTLVEIDTGRISLGSAGADGAIKWDATNVDIYAQLTNRLRISPTEMSVRNPVLIASGAIGTPDAQLDVDGDIAIKDGMTAPSATAGKAKLFVDTADGDLKIIFGDGTVKTIVVDT